MTAIFWVCVALLVYTHAGYPALLALLAPLRRRKVATDVGALPSVSVIVAAYAEQEVIADRVANLRALDYPADRVEVIVACDGSPDATAARAREAGADRLRQATCEIADLELASRGGGSRGGAEDTAALVSIARITA